MTDQTAEIARLRGERKVLADLLREALPVVSTAGGETEDESLALDELERRIRDALDAIALT